MAGALMTPAQSFAKLRVFIGEIAGSGFVRVDRGPSIHIICGDHGGQVMHRGGCPLCPRGGKWDASWVYASEYPKPN